MSLLTYSIPIIDAASEHINEHACLNVLSLDLKCFNLFSTRDTGCFGEVKHRKISYCWEAVTPSLRRRAPRWIHIHPDGPSCRPVPSKSVAQHFTLLDPSLSCKIWGLQDKAMLCCRSLKDDNEFFNCADTDSRNDDFRIIIMYSLSPSHKTQNV